MAAFRFFQRLCSRGAVRSAYDETKPRAVRAPLTARWSVRSEGRPACRWTA
jgi:hypothetical protein